MIKAPFLIPFLVKKSYAVITYVPLDGFDIIQAKAIFFLYIGSAKNPFK